MSSIPDELRLRLDWTGRTRAALCNWVQPLSRQRENLTIGWESGDAGEGTDDDEETGGFGK